MADTVSSPPAGTAVVLPVGASERSSLGMSDTTTDSDVAPQDVYKNTRPVAELAAVIEECVPQSPWKRYSECATRTSIEYIIERTGG